MNRWLQSGVQERWQKVFAPGVQVLEEEHQALWLLNNTVGLGVDTECTNGISSFYIF